MLRGALLVISLVLIAIMFIGCGKSNGDTAMSNSKTGNMLVGEERDGVSSYNSGDNVKTYGVDVKLDEGNSAAKLKTDSIKS
jgi:hypothetical protein